MQTGQRTWMARAAWMLLGVACLTPRVAQSEEKTAGKK